jgi:hypothetical protein
MATFDPQSFGSGLMQGFSFVEGIRQTREKIALAKREEERLIKDREDEENLKRRTLRASAYDQHRASGKRFSDLSDEDAITLFNERKDEVGDDGTKVTGVRRNADGSITPIVSGRDKYGRKFEGKPMTVDGTPVTEGGKEISFSADDADNMFDNWAAQYNPNFSARATKKAEIDRLQKLEDQDVEDNAITAQGILARRGRVTESPSPQAPGAQTPSGSAPVDRAEILRRQRDAESRSRHRNADGSLVTSKVGAQGVSQVMPATGVDPGFGVKPLQNDSEAEYVRFQDDYMAAMESRYGGDMVKALAAYNAGPGNVDDALLAADEAGQPENWMRFLPKPEETIPYVQKILGPESGAAQLASTDPQQAIQPPPAAAPAPAAAAARVSPTAPAGAAPARLGGDPRAELNQQILDSPVGQVSQGLTRVGQYMIDKPSELVQKGVTTAKWNTVKYEDVVAKPGKYLDSWNNEHGDVPPEVRAEVSKNLVRASRDRITTLAEVAKGKGPEAQAARRELTTLSRQLTEMSYSLSAAAGLPPKSKPGPELAEKLKDQPVPPPPKDDGAQKADLSALRRSSERNANSDAPELSQREINAASRMLARGKITAEQFERYVLTGYFQKGEIEQLDPTKSLIERLPDGSFRLVYDGAPAAMAEAAAKAKKGSGDGDNKVHNRNYGILDGIVTERYKDTKNSKLTAERRVQLLSAVYDNAAVLAGLGYDVWDHETGTFSLENLSEIQLHQLSNTLLDNIEKNEEPMSWFKTVFGADQSKPGMTEGLNQQVPRFDEGKFQGTMENIRRAAAAGNPKAQAALARGEDFIRQQLAGK